MCLSDFFESVEEPHSSTATSKAQKITVLRVVLLMFVREKRERYCTYMKITSPKQTDPARALIGGLLSSTMKAAGCLYTSHEPKPTSETRLIFISVQRKMDGRTACETDQARKLPPQIA